MSETSQGHSREQVIAERVDLVLRAAASWAREAPAPLHAPVKAVCIRLAEMVADQRHYLTPLPEPQDSERQAVLAGVAGRLTSAPVTKGVEQELAALTDLELKSTGSWAAVPAAQSEWVSTAIRYLEDCAGRVAEADRPDSYWADDVVAGVIASVRALLGVEELHARADAANPIATANRDTPAQGLEAIDPMDEPEE
ncbi:MAG: hypothetical protein AB7I33_12490 [Gemmatimonadales bacterium]